MSRRFCIALLGAYLFVVTLVVAAVSAAGDQANHLRIVGRGQIRFAGLGPERWARRWRREHRQVITLRRQLRAVLHHDPSTAEAIGLACAVYGSCSTLWRRASCETGGSFSTTSYNPGSSASGLFQFLPSTWATTPFGRFSIWSPYANALAAGWMEAHGRGGEWVCR